MANIEDLRVAIEKLRKKELDEVAAKLAMSDMTNWCFVHATKYMPLRNSDGQFFIPTTAMATDFEAGRFTVHATLNHTVKSHSNGSWDDVPIVVLAPYQDIVMENGDPVTVALDDTYWVPNPDKGLLLPKTAYIVQPDNNGPLFQIGEHGATYKTGNFTDDEIERILNMIRETYVGAEYLQLYHKYDKYLGKENDDEIMLDLLGGDEKLFRIYKNTENKREFLKGLLAADRDPIIIKFLRDAVVKLSMKYMKMNWYEFYGDTDVVARTAVSHGLYVEGHTHSPYGRLDHVATTIESFFEYDWDDIRHAIFKTNVESLYDTLKGWYTYNNGGQAYNDDKHVALAIAVIDNLIENKPINLLEMYQDEYKKYWESKFTELRNAYDDYNKKIVQVTYNLDLTNGADDRELKIQYYEKQKSLIMDEIQLKESRKKTMDENKNMWESIRRQCVRFESKYSMWRDEIVKSPGYEDLVQKLRVMRYGPNVVMNDTRTM